MMRRLVGLGLLVFILSGLFVGGAQPQAVGLIPPPWDKLAHGAVFAALQLALIMAGGALPMRLRRWPGWGWRCPRPLLWSAALLATATAAADELHQALSLPGRHAGWADFGADLFGVAVAVVWVLWSGRQSKRSSLPTAMRVRSRTRGRAGLARRYGTAAVAVAAVGTAAGLHVWLRRGEDARFPAFSVAGVETTSERTVALKPLVLPADDAPHTEAMEWWYYNGHLLSDAGERLAFHVAVFLHDGVVRHTVFHGSLTDLRTGRRWERQMRTAGVPSAVMRDGFDFQYQGWRVAGSGPRHLLQIEDRAFGLDLQFEDARPPMLHRAAGSSTPGLLDLGVGGISYYYSRPRMRARGNIVLGGKPQSVQGEVWFDHQWGDFDGAGLAWNWFALQLDDGSNLMLYELFDAQGRPVLKMGSTAGADGVSEPLSDRQIELTAQGVWSSDVSGARYPAAWQVRVPQRTLRLTPLKQGSEFDARTSTYNVYWEGAVRVDGDHRGRGFVEMSGYDRVKSLWPAAER